MLPLSAQDIVVQGKVTDISTGEPLIGVNVFSKGTTIGTVTDYQGDYSISVEPNSTLVFSYVGYKSMEKTVALAGELNAQLESDLSEIDELVVIGYGTVKKKDLTGSVSVVNVEDALKSTKTSVTEALQGRTPGVSVKKTAAPGDMGQIFIRGVGSFYTNSTPLFVIDGIATNDSRDFNPNDIESIQILKDASAAAIYGSRAFNGVVIITTKKGRSGENKVEFSHRRGYQFPKIPFDMMETPEWLSFNDLRWKNAYGENIYDRFVPKIEDSTINTNWFDKVFQVGQQSEYDLALSGGSKELSFRASVNYFSHEGIIKGSDFQRFTGRLNSTWTKGRLKIEESLLVSNTRSQSRGGGFSMPLGMPPVLPARDSLGNYTLGNYNASKELTRNTNPVAAIDKTLNENDAYHILATVNAELRLFDFLKYRINLGMDYASNLNTTQTKAIKTSLQDEGRSEYFEARGYGNNRLIENILEFSDTYGLHDINAIAGYTEQLFKGSDANIKYKDILQDLNGIYYFTLNNGQELSYLNQGLNYNSLRSVLGRIMYNYDSRYYLTASIRRDGSSRFREGRKYGNFPSFSVAWRVNRESFFPEWSFINDFKLRASYGKLGNQEIGNWKYASYLKSNLIYMFGPNEAINSDGQIDLTLVDKNIKWEEKISSNIGLEMYMFKNRLNISLDYYQSRNVDLLAWVDVPYYTGHTPVVFFDPQAIMTNAGTVMNTGLEAAINFRSFESPISYDLTLNLTTIKNEVLEVGGIIPYIPWHSGFSDMTRTTRDHPIGEFFLLEYDGIYQVDDPDIQNLTIRDKVAKPGDPKYKDNNPDGNIDDDDRVYAGSP